MPGYLDILRPNLFTQVVKQVVADSDWILGFMGFEPGGRNEVFEGHGREGIYHVWDDPRTAAKGRAPGTPAAKSAKQAMKAVPFTYPRMHDSISLLAEFFHNIGRIGDPVTRDEAGKDMIMRQTQVLLKKAANWRVAMTVGMLRDQLYYHESGDDWHLSYTSGSAIMQNNFRVPAGNKSQLNMTTRASVSVHGANIIDVPWSSPGANIPRHFALINKARAAQGLGPVRNVLGGSLLWQYLAQNDFLVTQAGIANAPFEYYERDASTRPDGTKVHRYLGRFKALPGVDFHIADTGLELWDGSAFTFTPHFPDTMALMMGDPDDAGKYKIMQGSEPIAEYDGGPESVKVGLASWSKKTSNPTATEVFVLDNALAVPHDPYDLIPATVVF